MLHEQQRSVWTSPGTAIAILAGVALRVLLMAWFASPLNPELWEFGTIATNLVRTGAYAYHTAGVPSAYMPPGYPLIIAALYAVLGIGSAAHLALAALLIAFEVAIPFLIARLATLIWGGRAGHIALLLALFWPQLLLLSGRFASSPISISLLLLTLVVLWSRPLSLPRAALCGLLIGLYGLFRMELAAFAPVIAYAVLAPGPLRGALRTRVAALAVLAAVAGLVVSPWLVRNYRVYDRLLVGTSGGYNLLRGHNERATGAGRKDAATGGEDSREEIPDRVRLREPDYTSVGDELVADALFRTEALSFIKSHPRREVELLFRKAFYFLVADFTHPVQRLWPVWIPSFAALLAGFTFWLRHGTGDPRQNTLWLIFALNGALSLVFFVLPRYRMAVEFVPLLFLAAWLDARWGARILRGSAGVR